MQKLMHGLTVLVFLGMATVPAMAATHWHFGASLRYLTFWSERDGGKQGLADLQGGGAELQRDGFLDWRLQGNSRIKMFMRSDVLEGYIEFGYKEAVELVSAREYWGRYNFNEKAYIVIGQQRQLFTQFISYQGWDGNLSLASVGVSAQSASPKITLGYGNFAVALVKPYDGNVNNRRNALAGELKALYASHIDPGVKVGLHADTDIYFPQIQAQYEYLADAWRLKLAGAYQHIRINKVGGYWESPLTGNGRTFSGGGGKADSWLLGFEGEIDFGPLRLSAAASVGQNWSDAGWNDETSNMNAYWTDAYMLKNLGVIPVFDAMAPAAGGRVAVKWKNTTSFMAAFVSAYRLTEALRLEAGVGYRHDRNEGFSRDGHIWTVYLQAAYTVAPGFTVTPEVGYIDLGKHVRTKNAMGDICYLGAKWQMDF